jgi:hypothetical protein
MVSNAKFSQNILPLSLRFALDCLLKAPRRHLMLGLGHRTVASAIGSLQASPAEAEAVFEPVQYDTNM